MKPLPRLNDRYLKWISGITLCFFSSVSLSQGIIDFSPAGLLSGIEPSFSSSSRLSHGSVAMSKVSRGDGEGVYSGLGFFKGWSPWGGDLRIGAGFAYLTALSSLDSPGSFDDAMTGASYLDLLLPPVDGVSSYFGVGWGRAWVGSQALGVNMDLGLFYQRSARLEPSPYASWLYGSDDQFLRKLESNEIHTGLSLGFFYKF